MTSNARNVQPTPDHKGRDIPDVTINGASDHINDHLEELAFIYDVNSEFDDSFDETNDTTTAENFNKDGSRESSDDEDDPNMDDSKQDADDSNAYETCDDGNVSSDADDYNCDEADFKDNDFKDDADNFNKDNSSDDDGSDSNAEESKHDTSESEGSDFSDNEEDYNVKKSCNNLEDSKVAESSASNDDSDSEDDNFRDNWRSSKTIDSCDKQKDSAGDKVCDDEGDSELDESSEDSDDSDDDINRESAIKNTPSRTNTRGSRSWLPSQADPSECDDSSDNDDDDDNDDDLDTRNSTNNRCDDASDNDSDQLGNSSSFDITDSLVADIGNTSLDRIDNPGLDSNDQNVFLDDILCSVDMNCFDSSYESSDEDDSESSDEDDSDDSRDDEDDDELAESQKSSDLNLKRKHESNDDPDDCEESEELWDEEQEPMTKAQRLMEINWKWMKFYSTAAPEPCQSDSSSLKKSHKSVVISLEKNERIPVINEAEWGEDYVAARKGPWLAFAAERRKFMQRIKYAQIDIGWVLLPTHRAKILDAALQRKKKELSRSTEDRPVTDAAARRRFLQRIKHAQINIGWVFLSSHRIKILDAALQREKKELSSLVEHSSHPTEELPVMDDASPAI